MVPERAIGIAAAHVGANALSPPRYAAWQRPRVFVFILFRISGRIFGPEFHGDGKTISHPASYPARTGDFAQEPDS
jgi:galactose mutarotase-like enzyme